MVNIHNVSRTSSREAPRTCHRVTFIAAMMLMLSCSSSRTTSPLTTESPSRTPASRQCETELGDEVPVAPRTGVSHAGGIVAVAMSASGRILVTGDDTGRVILWDVDLRESRGAVDLGSPVSALALDSSARHIYAATHGGVLQAFRANTMSELWATHTEGAFVRSISLLSRSCSLVTTNSDERSPYSVSYEVRFIAADTGEVYATVPQIQGEPWLVVAESSQQVMFTDRRSARIYTSSGHVEREILGEVAGGFARMSVSRTGERAVFRDSSGTRLWSTNSSRSTPLPRLQGWGSIAISPDGRYVADEFRGDIYIYRTDTDPPQRVMEVHGPDVLAIDFRFDGERLLASSRDGSVTVFDVRTGLSVARLVHGNVEVHVARYSATGDRILTWSVDGRTSVWSDVGTRLFDLSTDRR